MSKVHLLDETRPGLLSAQRSAKGDAYSRIRNAIIFCEIAPGEPINERELAARFQISRTPLREILVKLAHQKLIVLKPNRSAFIAPVDYGTARAIYEVRLPLERTTAALAADRASSADVEGLLHQIDKLEQDRKRADVAAFIDSDRDFHAQLARVAANPLLAELLEDLHNSNLRFWYHNRHTMYDGILDVDNLARIARAVRAGNSRVAADAMADHIMAYVEATERFYRRSIETVDAALRHRASDGTRKRQSA